MSQTSFSIELDTKPNYRVTLKRSAHGKVTLIRPTVADCAIGASEGTVHSKIFEELCAIIKSKGKNGHDVWSLLCELPGNGAVISYRCSANGIRFNCSWIDSEICSNHYLESDVLSWQQLSGMCSLLTAPTSKPFYSDRPMFGL